MRSSWGTPISPAMACSGSSHDTCSTKSPEPCAAAVATMLPGALVEVVAQPLDRAGREAAGDDLAQMGVLRGVHVEQHELARLALLADRALAVAGQGGVLQAGEDIAAPRNLFDVLVLGHHPVAAVIESAGADGLLVPPDRRGPAQLGQFLDGQPLGVDVRVGEIEPGRQIRGRLGGRSLDNPLLDTKSSSRLLCQINHCYTTVGKHPTQDRRSQIATCSLVPSPLGEADASQSTARGPAVALNRLDLVGQTTIVMLWCRSPAATRTGWNMIRELLGAIAITGAAISVAPCAAAGLRRRRAGHELSGVAGRAVRQLRALHLRARPQRPGRGLPFPAAQPVPGGHHRVLGDLLPAVRGPAGRREVPRPAVGGTVARRAADAVPGSSGVAGGWFTGAGFFPPGG